MSIFRLMFAAALAFAGSIGISARPASAQTSIDAEGLKAIQGRWVSRFEDNSTEIEVTGTEIRYVSIQRTGRSADPATPGQLVAVITGIEVSRTFQSELDKRSRKDFKLRGRCWTTSGFGRWFLTEQPTCTGALMGYTYKNERTYQPLLDYDSLTFGGLTLGGGDFFRPEAKRRIFGPASAAPAPRPTPPRPPVKKPDPAPVIKPKPPAPATPVKGTTGQIPSGKVLQEAPANPADAARAQANRDQAAAAKRQLEQNAANQRAYDQAVRAREAAIARQRAEYQAALARTEAERLRREQEHAAALARWQADVEACKKGDKSRCAK